MLNSIPSSLVFRVTRHSSPLPTCCQGSVVLFFPRNNWQSETPLYNYKTIQLSNCRTFPSIRSAKKNKKSDFNSASPRSFQGNQSLVLPGASCSIPNYPPLVPFFLFFLLSSLLPYPFPINIPFFRFPQKSAQKPPSPALHHLSLLGPRYSFLHSFLRNESFMAL
jgi:hypothetical protein